MPSTVVHAAVALLLAVGLLRTRLDRRVLGVLLVVVVFPELDTVAGLVLGGAHRALLHTLLVPLVAAGLLWYDTRRRSTSWLRARWGDGAVSLAWVALFVHVFAHLGLDYAHLEGVNLFYPLLDRFFRLDGYVYLSSTDGFVQTFVEVTTDADAGGTTVDTGATGTTDTVRVANPVEPSAEAGADAEAGNESTDPDRPPERTFPVAVWGWQLYLVCLGLFAALARRLQSPPPERDGQ